MNPIQFSQRLPLKGTLTAHSKTNQEMISTETPCSETLPLRKTMAPLKAISLHFSAKTDKVVTLSVQNPAQFPEELLPAVNERLKGMSEGLSKEEQLLFNGNRQLLDYLIKSNNIPLGAYSNTGFRPTWLTASDLDPSYKKRDYSANIHLALETPGALDKKYIPYFNLHDLKLTDTTGQPITLNRTFLPHANLVSSDLSGAVMTSTDLEDANLVSANLTGVKMSTGKCKQTNFSSSNLEGATLFYSSFRDASFEGANLAKVKAISSDFNGANFTYAYLNEGDFTGCKFVGANLSKLSDYTNSQFQKADFSKALMTPEFKAYVKAQGALVDPD